MDTSRIIRLIDIGLETDSSSTQKEFVTVDREVFCRTRSVGVKEKYAAMAVERNPEIVADLPEGAEYAGEIYAVVDGARYKVIRSYVKGSKTELTLERTRDLDGVI